MRNTTFKIVGFIILVIVLSLGIRLYVTRAGAFREMPQNLADFQAIEIDGGKTTFGAIKGKATLVVLSASWCPACIAELPTLKALHQEFYESGLRIVMVSEDDNVKIASRFKKKYGMPWTMVHWNYDLMNALGNPRVIPVSFLVDSEGKFDYIEAGIIDERRMRRAIKALLD